MDLGVQLMFPRLGEGGVDGTVLAVTLGTALATGLLFGLAPALLHSDHRQMDGSAPAHGGRAGFGPLRGGAARRARAALLVIAEVALAMILLIGGGLLLRSLVKLTSIEPGYRAANVLTFQVALPATRYPPVGFARSPKISRRALRATPGVQAAAYAQQLPWWWPHRDRVCSTHARAPGAVRAWQSGTAPRQPRLPLRHGHAHRPGPGP